MLKMIVGIVLFAALALFVIIKGGSSLDLAPGKNDTGAMPAPAEVASDAASVAAMGKSSTN